jgi:hypothetical protein
MPILTPLKTSKTIKTEKSLTKLLKKSQIYTFLRICVKGVKQKLRRQKNILKNNLLISDELGKTQKMVMGERE